MNDVMEGKNESIALRKVFIANNTRELNFAEGF